MTVLLLKDIRVLLSFISAARESDIDLQLQCELKFLNLAHAFDISTTLDGEHFNTFIFHL